MLEDVLVPIISIIPENPKLINCFASGQPLIIKEPESKTSNSFTISILPYGSIIHINNKGFVSRFICGLIGNFSINPRDIKYSTNIIFLQKNLQKIFLFFF